MLGKARLGKSMLLAAALSGFVMLGGAAPAQARDRDDNCAQRIRKAEASLDRETRRHGEHSRQAAKRRHQLEEARERCRGDRDHDRDRHRDRDRR
jgi:hypothetical protein